MGEVGPFKGPVNSFCQIGLGLSRDFTTPLVRPEPTLSDYEGVYRRSPARAYYPGLRSFSRKAPWKAR